MPSYAKDVNKVRLFIDAYVWCWFQLFVCFSMQEFAQYHLNKRSNHELETRDELLKGGTSKLLFEPMFFILLLFFFLKVQTLQQ